MGHGKDGRLPVVTVSGFSATEGISSREEMSPGGTPSLRRRSARQKSVDRRIHAALEKRELGDELTEYEWMIVQYALGGACPSRRERR